MPRQDMALETLLGRSESSFSSPLLDRSTTTAYDGGEPGPFFYQRYAHRTGAEAEALLSALDGGRALLFPSGMSAVTSVLIALAEPGTKIAVADDAFFGVAVLLKTELARWGIEIVEFDQTGEAPPDADFVWLEAPAQPFLSFPDIEAHVERVRTHGGRVIVDATVATPVLLKPLALGVDIVIHSATKYLAGHADCLLGVAAFGSPADADRVLEFRAKSGSVAAPDAAWLLLRGLRTLPLRVHRQSASALTLAERLASHPAVERVRYPGLGDPIAARYLTAFGGLLSFDVRGGAKGAALIERSLELIVNGTSLGGFESILEARARWEGARCPENLLRFSVGLEDPDDLWRDLEQALARL
jgi:cystathionine gamma-synthase